MSNKKEGTVFEKEFCKLADTLGFWATRLNEHNTGKQPADVMLGKYNVPVLVDCKNCNNNIFPFSRIEENQECSMRKWMNKGNREAYFALKVRSDDVYMVPFINLMYLRENGKKQLNYTQIQTNGILFADWVEEFNANYSE